MRGWIGIGEAADLLFLGVNQPADTVLWCMAINKWAVLVWHPDTMASNPNHRVLPYWLQRRHQVPSKAGWMKRICLAMAIALTAISTEAYACISTTERHPIHTCDLWWDGHISDEIAQERIGVKDGDLRSYCAKTRPL